MKKKTSGKKRKMKRKTKVFLFANMLAITAIFIYCSKDNINDNPEPDSGKISIACFNIQVFGVSKLGKPEVMEKIIAIINNFDAVAIQEIRSTEDNIVPNLVGMLGTGWDFKISKRLGRTSSKEQYALVYRKASIIVDSVYQVSDPEDKLHREPFVCYCRSGNFDFSVIIVHTDPDEVQLEMNALDDILKGELKKEKDALLMGDMNASPSEFEELGRLPGIFSIIPDGKPTNVRGTKTYDNIVFIKDELKEYLRGDVYDFKSIFSLSLEQALDISDHFPVYAVFRTDMTDDDGIIAFRDMVNRVAIALIHK